MGKVRICTRCGHRVLAEKDKSIDYPYVCPNCDENLYGVETTLISKAKYKKMFIHRLAMVTPHSIE